MTTVSTVAAAAAAGAAITAIHTFTINFSIAQLQQQQQKRRLISSRFLLSLFNVNPATSLVVCFSSHFLTSLFLSPFPFLIILVIIIIIAVVGAQVVLKALVKARRTDTKEAHVCVQTLSNIDQLSNFFSFLL